MRRRVAALLLFCLAMLLVGAPAMVGCEKSASPRARPHTCLLVGRSQDDPLWPVLQASARSYEATAPGLTVKMLAPPEAEEAAQVALIRQHLDATVHAVCLQTIPGQATHELIREISARGVAVILVGRDLPQTARAGYVGPDEFEMGKALVKALQAGLKERRTFMVLHAGDLHDVYAPRLQGLNEGLRQAGHLQELHRFDCGAEPAEALRIITEQARRYPQLGMWVCVGDWPAYVDPELLRAALGGQTGVVMIGATPPVWALMERGLCPAAVGTDYGTWGYAAVDMAEMGFRRSLKPGQLRLTGPQVIRAEQLDEFRRTWNEWLQGKNTSPIRSGKIG